MHGNSSVVKTGVHVLEEVATGGARKKYGDLWMGMKQQTWHALDVQTTTIVFMMFVFPALCARDAAMANETTDSLIR